MYSRAGIHTALVSLPVRAGDRTAQEAGELGDQGTVSRQSPRKVRQQADQAWTGAHICLNSKALARGQRGHVRPGVTLPPSPGPGPRLAGYFIGDTHWNMPLTNHAAQRAPSPLDQAGPGTHSPIKVSRSDALPVLAEA